MSTAGSRSTATPDLDVASAPWPERGLHVHVELRGGVLVGVRIASRPAARQDEGALAMRDRVARHLARGDDGFADVSVDLGALGDFHRRSLDAIRAIPPGRTIGYGELAAQLGSPGASRAVGAAMARNPCPIVVPCHRVLPTGRRVGNYSGEGGWETKMALLRIERARGVWAQRTISG